MSIQLSNIVVPDILKIAEFTVKPAEHVLISGPSGKGKTTLLHLIGGLLRPATGQVQVQNQNLSQLNERELSQFRKHTLGFAFQKLNLIEHMTALENLLLVANADSQDSALSALDKVGLKNKAHLYANQLSLGEQQRVAISRLILQSPEILLADEPTSSLDDDNATQVMDLLQEAAKGKILLVVSHDRRLHGRFSRVIDIREILS